MKQIVLSILTISLVALSSCKKDDEPMARQKTKTELLTGGGSWRVSTYTINPAADMNGDGVKESDVYAAMADCEKDNRTTFYINGTGQIEEGSLRCDPDDEQVTPVTWGLNQDETVLTVDGIQYEIVLLSNTELRVRQEELIGGDTHTHTILFIH